MKKYIVAALVTILPMTVAAPVQAHITTNALFTCTGELVKDGADYLVRDQVPTDDDPYPTRCYIDAGKPLHQVLKVCHVGDYCTVSAKGRSSNGNMYVIQKVLDVQLKLHCSGISRFPYCQDGKCDCRDAI